jgi:hypothetical protein
MWRSTIASGSDLFRARFTRDRRKVAFITVYIFLSACAWAEPSIEISGDYAVRTSNRRTLAVNSDPYLTSRFCGYVKRQELDDCGYECSGCIRLVCGLV